MMKTTWRAELGRMLVWLAVLCLPMSAAAQNAVNVTIEADAADLLVRETTTVRAYGQIDGAIELVRFDVTVVAAGTSTFTVAPGASLTGVENDFQVAQLGFAGTFTGGDYSAASVAMTVSGELELFVRPP